MSARVCFMIIQQFKLDPSTDSFIGGATYSKFVTAYSSLLLQGVPKNMGIQ